MWYVCDKEFWLTFSDGFKTKAEAEVELIKIKERVYKEFHKEQNFIVLFIEN